MLIKYSKFGNHISMGFQKRVKRNVCQKYEANGSIYSSSERARRAVELGTSHCGYEFILCGATSLCCWAKLSCQQERLSILCHVVRSGECHHTLLISKISDKSYLSYTSLVFDVIYIVGLYRRVLQFSFRSQQLIPILFSYYNL